MCVSRCVYTVNVWVPNSVINTSYPSIECSLKVKQVAIKLSIKDFFKILAFFLSLPTTLQNIAKAKPYQ